MLSAKNSATGDSRIPRTSSRIHNPLRNVFVLSIVHMANRFYQLDAEDCKRLYCIAPIYRQIPSGTNKNIASRAVGVCNAKENWKGI
jgi:hypothetical protein